MILGTAKEDDMLWWLTVFFLLESGWVAGDTLDGWGSRPYASYEDCEARRRFANLQTMRHPLDLPARWVCNRGQPAATPSPPVLDAGSGRLPGHYEAHWYEPPNPLGLEIFTHEKLGWIAEDGIGLRYTGPLRAPLADQLRDILLTTPQQYNHAILELDSDGGELTYVKELVTLLQEVGKRMEFTTRVTEGSLCASGCIPLFLQGQKRKASGSSIWVFHGARRAFTNIPDPDATQEYLDLLSAAGMDSAFRHHLEADNRIFLPGSFILSGHELFTVHRSGIITELLPVWRKEEPVFPSNLGPR